MPLTKHVTNNIEVLKPDSDQADAGFEIVVYKAADVEALLTAPGGLVERSIKELKAALQAFEAFGITGGNIPEIQQLLTDLEALTNPTGGRP